ncbi:MAG TPA: PhnD/SsuA/transferrin family substrate-binding protein [Planctomycetaceae bacterium]|jgi:ABC-type phosphate/phosphonate transport system substrate-binding protein
MSRRILAGIVFLIATVAAVSARSEDQPTQAVAAPGKAAVRIGAVAYSPGVVTVFNDLRRYLNRHEFHSDYVLYSNYDALVAALQRREIDIAWNTPLAHAQFHVRSGGTSQTLVMRDVDFNVRSVLVARTDSAVNSLADLPGKRVILGSADAAEATVLPIFYLKKDKVDFDKITTISLDKEVDFKGNPCCSPSHVLEALKDGRGDVGIVTESLWRQSEAAQSGNQKLKKIWTSPAFSHCVFTASKDFDTARARRFIELMTAMTGSEPGCGEIMRLEGTKKWLPGRPEGFADLVEAIGKR